MKSEQQIRNLLEVAKDKYKEAKEAYINVFTSSERTANDIAVAEKNLSFRTTQLKMLEGILELPEEERILNSNPILEG